MFVQCVYDYAPALDPDHTSEAAVLLMLGEAWERVLPCFSFPRSFHSRRC
jgi:hypothetical protein